MNGNIHEWVAGVRLVYGEVQIIEGNNASLPTCDLSATSEEWKAIDAATGDLITPDGSGTTDGSVKLDWKNSTWTYSTSIATQSTTNHAVTFASLVCDDTIGDAAKLLLQTLALMPDSDLTGDDIDSTYGNDRFALNNGTEETVIMAGGVASLGELCGVFRLNIQYTRDTVDINTICRSCMIET